MSKPTDVRVVGTQLYFLPVTNRVPLKFGPGVTTSVTVARAAVVAEDRGGNRQIGWGETPLSVQWVWPSSCPLNPRNEALKQLCCQLAQDWCDFETCGHALEVGYSFQQQKLFQRVTTVNETRDTSQELIPHLAGLVCCSPFDLALHDAFGKLCHQPVYETYNAQYLNTDLATYLTPAEDTSVSFSGSYPADYLVKRPSKSVDAWHLVGGLDAVEESDLTGSEPNDGYPVVLPDWIRTDGLRCLKIKLRGNNQEWDYNRITRIGQLAVDQGVQWLTTDFNCTVTNPGYVNEILDRLMHEHPRLYGMILYVEQPFPYDLRENRIDVHSTSARKPLFMDESAHDWRLVALGRQLGWTGVALKTCKTQTGALLSLCWAKAHGMTLMVQDLTNPMLAQIPHVLLAAYAGTIMGVETNSMQFYPDASEDELKVHPELYRRRDGRVNWSSVRGNGFGYRIDEIGRTLPEPVVSFGTEA